MNCYIAELDEAKRIAAVWVKREKARGPAVFDPRHHTFDREGPNEFIGAPPTEIIDWLSSAGADI